MGLQRTNKWIQNVKLQRSKHFATKIVKRKIIYTGGYLKGLRHKVMTSAQNWPKTAIFLWHIPLNIISFFKFHTNFTLPNCGRVRQKFSYPLVLRTSTISNLVVRNPRVLVQKVLLKTKKQWGIYFTAYYHIKDSLFAGKLTGLVTKVRFLSQMELVKKQMIEMAVEWRSFKGIFNLILTSIRFAFMTIT